MDTTTFANPMLTPDDEDAEETGGSRPAADELQAEDDDGEDEQDEAEGPEDLQLEGLEEPGGDEEREMYVPELEQARKNDSSNYGQYTNRGRVYYRHTQASAGGHTLNPPPDGVKFLMKEEPAEKFEVNYVRAPPDNRLDSSHLEHCAWAALKSCVCSGQGIGIAVSRPAPAPRSCRGAAGRSVDSDPSVC